MPVPGFETLFVYDVAYQWRELTGKPCVLAIWAGRPDALTPEVAADFQSSLRYGQERIPEIAEAASIQLDLPPKALERYLTDNIHFGLEPDYLAGLELYYQKCAAVGAIPHAKPLRFAAGHAVPGAGARAGR
jgi:predicted solute-binding protein